MGYHLPYSEHLGHIVYDVTGGKVQLFIRAMTVGIATGVGAGFLLAMFVVVIVIAVFLLVWRRKRKYSQPTDHVLESPMHGHKGKYMQPCMIIIVEFLLHILSLICFKFAHVYIQGNMLMVMTNT